MPLAPLDADGIGALAEVVLGEVPPPALRVWLSERSRGNALFAHGLLRALLEEDADLSAPVLRRLPENLAERVRARLADLDPGAVEILEVLAVVGRSIGLGEFVRLAGRAAEELEDLLPRLTRSRLVLEEERGRELTYELGHPLVAEAIYQNASGLRRRRLHRLVAGGLHAQGRLSEAASHFARSAEVGDPEAISVLTDALRQAEEREASREALTILGAVVELVPSGDERWIEVADAMSWEAEWVVDRRAGVHAAVGIRALREIDAVLDLRPAPGRQAQVNSRLANFLAYGTGDLEEAEVRCRKALALFEQVGDRRRALWAGFELVFITGWVKGDPAVWEVEARAVSEAAEQIGERSVAMEASWSEGAAAMWRGRFQDSERAFQRSLALARETGKRYPIAFRLESLAAVAALEGRAQDAAKLVGEVRTLYPGREGGLVPEFEMLLLWVLGDVDATLGSHLPAFIRSLGSMGKTRAFGFVVAALMQAESGQFGAARRLLANAQAAYDDRPFFTYPTWCAQADGVLAFREGRRREGLETLSTAAASFVEMGVLPWAAFAFVDLADLAAEAQKADVAEKASADLATVAETLDRDLYRALAAIAASWANLARAQPGEATMAAKQAVGILSGMGYPCFLGRALDVLGRSLISTDRVGAVKALEEAAATFDRCGAHFRKERAVEALKGLRGRGAKAAAALSGRASLTRREREVARLAVQGMTAKEIAEQLILGSRTVEGHLANVYAKLGVRSKVELTRRARELDL
jgi:DNA-binding CsgD family transcriptional regulator/tetratricopeptide (TPR) repeat protein